MHKRQHGEEQKIATSALPSAGPPCQRLRRPFQASQTLATVVRVLLRSTVVGHWEVTKGFSSFFSVFFCFLSFD
jgi:hypothetical protein